jgi:NAD(P) transhydrogenase subunit beta
VDFLVDLAYIVASVLFIFGLKMLGRAETARRGNMISALGMFLAVVVTMLVGGLDFTWIIVGVVIGGAVGAFAARTLQMTAMPEMVALFNGSGGLASLLVGWAGYLRNPDGGTFTATAIVLTVLIGGIAFTGSLVALGKLAGWLTGRPLLYRGQQLVNGLIVVGVVAVAVLFVLEPVSNGTLFLVIIGAALLLGILAVIPIGGADMPIVISLLNSYSGLAASAAGFILGLWWGQVD